MATVSDTLGGDWVVSVISDKPAFTQVAFSLVVGTEPCGLGTAQGLGGFLGKVWPYILGLCCLDILIVVAFLYFVFIRGKRKQEAEAQEQGQGDHPAAPDSSAGGCD
ncbi:MAG: hypothetical protein PVJ32_04765 [Anaerolineales bacterium]